MTVINLHIGTDAAHMFTDMGVVDYASGALVALSHKVILLPVQGMAVTVSGSLFASEYVRGFMSSKPPADAEALEMFGVDYIKGLLDACPVDLRAQIGRFLVAVVGWNDRPFGQLFIVADPLSDNVECLDVSSDFFLPPVDGWIDNRDIQNSAIALCKAQRNNGEEMPSGRLARIASGAVIQTAGIQTSVLHVWPTDHVGEILLV